MKKPPQPRRRMPAPRRWLSWAAAVATLAVSMGQASGQAEAPRGCERVAAFYEAHEVAQDFFPCGFYGGPGVHPMLGMPPAVAAEVSLERFASYGVNVVISALDIVEAQGRPPALGAVGQLLYGTLLPRYEIKALPSLTNHGFRFHADAFAGVQRDKPLCSDAEMATIERKLASKLAFAADLSARYPDTILGFVSDDEPHLMAPSVAAARLLEKHTGRLVTFPMPTYDHAVAFSEHIQPMSADWYVCGDMGRDSWCIAARMRTIARQWPDRMFWFVPLAISFTGGHEPTLPNMPDSRTTRTELRLQCWSALALGAKGVLFYNPGGWAFTWGGNEDPLFDPLGRPNAPHPRQDNLAEIRSLAADFTAIGPSLLTACPVADPAIRIDCGAVRYATFNGPALDCGLLRDAANGRDFLIPWNNDIDHDQRGTLQLPDGMLTGRRRLYDLHDLVPVGDGTDDRLGVSLPPGGGRVYMVGDEAAFAAVRDSILRHRVAPERVRSRSLALRLRAKAGPRVPDDVFADANAAVARAQAAESAGEWQAAAAAYREAITDLERRAEDLPAAAAEAALEKAGSILAGTDDLMRTHDTRLYSFWYPTDTARLADAAFPLQAEQRDWIALVKRYLTLEYRLFTGAGSGDSASAVKTAALALARDATAQRATLWKKFSGRLREERRPFRLALITPDRNGFEETMAYAWAYDKCEVCWITPDEGGALADIDGRPFDPDDYDVVWIHQLRYTTPPDDGAAVDPARAVIPALMGASTLESIRRYITDGGGLLLTGIAGLYAVPLGLENVPPDRVQENDYLTRDLTVGIIPAPGAERHPVLAHVPAAGHLTNGGPRRQVVAAECTWEKRRPTGTVLAHEIDGQYGRLGDLATIVQYTLGKGTVLVLGGLGCDLTPGGGAGGDSRSRARRTTLDALEYLAGGQQYAVRNAAEPAAETMAAARPLGKRDARPEVGPTWMQNARARVEIIVHDNSPMPEFRYLRWDANTGTWIPFVHHVTIGSGLLDPVAMASVQKKYGVYSTFDGVRPTRLTQTVADESASLGFRLERPDIWAEYRLTLIKDSPFVLVAQTGRSRPDMAGSATMVLDPPLEIGVAGTTDNPADFTEHLARDLREQGWLLRVKRFFAAATPRDSRLCAIFPASVAPAPQVILMTPGIKQLSQLSLPFFYVGHVGPAAGSTAALRQWANEQFAPLEAYRIRDANPNP